MLYIVLDESAPLVSPPQTPTPGIATHASLTGSQECDMHGKEHPLRHLFVVDL